ncbi:MAG: peptidoglycan-binding domain-containing protein [Verrucomicrobia bacterium]|nr:peptidoglycan-binding domain-containing protein [Verrucomicrobiota bacterium]
MASRVSRRSVAALACVVCVGGLAGCKNLADFEIGLRDTLNKTFSSANESGTPEPVVAPVAVNEKEEIVVLDRRGVKRLQARLTKLGFRPGPVDGMLGKQTIEAINSYQAAFALTVREAISTKFLKHLAAMSADGFADEQLSKPQQPSQVQQALLPPPPPQSPVNLTADDLPSYLPGTSFIYSNGDTERVLGTKDLVVRWSRGDGTTYGAHRNFLLPRSYWASAEERGTATVTGAPDDQWPFREGAKVSFSAKVTMQRGDDSNSTKRRVDKWRCQNDGRRTITVEAGTFKTLVLVCSRGEKPTAPEIVRTWYYSKTVRHYVRFVESDPKRKTAINVDLIAVRPGAPGWPPIVRAALARALVHALETTGNASQMPWASSGVNTRVSIDVKSRFVADDGRPCRQFVQIWSENGRRRHYPAVACKTALGQWIIPGLESSTANSLATSGDLS